MVREMLADCGKELKQKPHLKFNVPPWWNVSIKGLGIENTNLHVGGEWVDATAGSSYQIRNPAHRQEVLAEVQAAGVEGCGAGHCCGEGGGFGLGGDARAAEGGTCCIGRTS